MADTAPQTESFATIPEAIEELRAGRMLIVVDDENRENEGDFVMAAEHCTPEAVNFMARHGRGLICVPTTTERLEELELQPMVMHNTSHLGTNFTVSVDVANGGTGISAADRSATVQKLADPAAKPSDLARPGHIFPLGARDGGVLVRAGHTEAVVDLCRLAKLNPVGVLCEILNEDGSMARLPELRRLAAEHGLKIVAIRDLIAWRTLHEQLVRRVVTTTIPNPYGVWKMHLYENLHNNDEHIVMELGEPAKQDSALIRVHSKCFTGDTLLSLRCDCGPQLRAAMKRIGEEGHGVLIYMDQEGRGIGLRAKMMAYNLQQEGLDTVDANIRLGFKADLREYGIGAQILRDLGLTRIRIMTNNPKKIVGIQGFGLEIVGRIPLEVGEHEHNAAYLQTKAEKMGHLFKMGLGQCGCSNSLAHVATAPEDEPAEH
jgi:3,4-dihydroxy 2-butanone 4-phosphate synthase/GTP cyclohydrolase II